MNQIPSDIEEEEDDMETEEEYMETEEEMLEEESFEEEMPIIPEKRGSRVIRSEQKRGSKMAILAVILSAVTLLVVGVGVVFLYAILQEQDIIDNLGPPDITLTMPESGHYIEYQGVNIPVMETVPVNGYDARGFYYDINDYIHYEVDGREARIGIDVSYHQNDIDWAQVAETGIEFAMVRVGRRGYAEEGTLGMDTHYVQNLVGATQNGIDVGVYFFSQATNMVELEEEVDLLLGLIQNFDISYPVVFDWEFVTTADWARTNNTTGEEITAMAKRFCERVALAGYQPMVYFNVEMGYMYLDLSELTDYSFWLAELNSFPRFYYHFDMWQYTFTGTVAGIEGPVDMNISFRDFAAESKTTQ